MSRYLPEVIAIDFETADDKGASVDFWRKDFRVLSCALSWITQDGSIKHTFYKGEDAVADRLKRLAADGIPLVAHNLQFEYGVTKARFPWFPLELFQFDTQRLVQCYDNGGKDEAYVDEKNLSLDEQLAYLENDVKQKTGLSLEAGASRILPSIWHNHKQKYYLWLRENKNVAAGKEGANLHLLPDDMLADYNTMDTDITLILYRHLTDLFRRMEYDWRPDHGLHVRAIGRLVQMKIDGIKVNREQLKEFVDQTREQQEQIIDRFGVHHVREIGLFEERRLDAWINGLKTEVGRQRRRETAMAHREEWAFNPRSTTQLAQLFVGDIGVTPQFWTKESKERKKKTAAGIEQKPFEPKPSFRAAHLHSYGEGGKILETLKKRQIVGKQGDNLHKLSETDGRWHAELRACGTRTNRFAGGGSGDVRLNIQALGRREQGLMEVMVPDTDDDVFVSIDLGSGEPTVTAQYSGDQNYYNACFGMVGKTPFIDEKRILQIDDIYLMGAYLSPTGSKAMVEAWNTTFEGLSFAERWNADAMLDEKDRVIRKELKKVRAFHKTLMLAMQYSQAPKGMVAFAYDQGHVLQLEDAKEFWTAYWFKLFPDVRKLSERLQATFKRRGCLVNGFGYRMTPERPSLCLNYMIQSSVSGVMKLFEDKLFYLADYAKYVATIHDETLVQIPKSKIEDFRLQKELATEYLNKDLAWDVKIRTGFAVGGSLFTAK